MVQSFQDVHLDRVFFRYDHPFVARELAELVWVVCHQNIQAFLTQVPKSRQHRLRFEDLVTRPQETLMDLCAFMGLAFHPDMAMPYKAKERKMTDGMHAASTMLGDMKFHQHTDIDPALAESWKTSEARVPLGDITWRMAEELGYARLEEEKNLSEIVQVDDDELARLLDELEELSEEEARLLFNGSTMRKPMIQ
jgi:hypothetical protein